MYVIMVALKNLTVAVGFPREFVFTYLQLPLAVGVAAYSVGLASGDL